MIELFLKGKTQPNESVNAKLISHGYAKLIPDKVLPPNFSFLLSEEEKAISKKIGIW